MKNATLVTQYESLKVLKYFTTIFHVLKCSICIMRRNGKYVYVYVISVCEAMWCKFIPVQVITLVSLLPPPLFFHSGDPLVKGFCW